MAQTDELFFQHITIEENLSQNSVNAITQDSIGLIWCGTNQGLDIIGSNEILDYQPLGKIISFTTSGNLIFFQTVKGIFSISSLNEGTFEFNEDNITKEFITSLDNPIIAFGVLENTLVILTEKSLISKSKNGVEKIDTTFNSKIHIGSFSQKETTLHWVNNDGLFKYSLSDKKVERISLLPEIDNISCIAYQGKNDYLIGSREMEVWRVNDFQRNKISLDSTIGKSSISALLVDTKDRIWIGTKYSGLFLKKKGSLEHYTYDPIKGNTSISGNRINSLYQSQDNTILIGTTGNGLNIAQEKRQVFNHYYKKSNFSHLDDNDVTALYPYKDSFLLVSKERQSLILINKSQSETEVREIPIGANDGNLIRVYSFAKRGNEILLGTSEGLKVLDYNTLTIKSNNDFPNKLIYRLNYDEELERTIVTTKDLENSNTYSIIFIYNSSNDLLFTDTIPSVNAILKVKQNSKDSYFFGTNKGIFQMDATVLNKANIIKKIGEKYEVRTLNYPKQQGLEKKLWIGTLNRGALSYDLDNGTIERYNSYEFEGEIIYNILDDEHGALWLSTNHGLFSLRNKDSLILKSHFILKDGLQSNEFNFSAAAKNGKKLLFGGINGITSFYPNSQTSIPLLKEQVIYEIKYEFNQEQFKIYWTDATTPQVKLPNNFYNLEIKPIILNLNQTSLNQIRYRILSQENWTSNQMEVVKLNRYDFFNIFENFLFSFRREKTVEVSSKISNSKWQNTVIPIHICWWSSAHTFFSILLIWTLIFSYLYCSQRKKKKKLEIINQKINEISRLKTRKTICEQSILHLIEHFEFDYVLISLIEFDERKILGAYEDIEKLRKKNIESWCIKNDFWIDVDEEKTAYPDVQVKLINANPPYPAKIIRNKIIKTKAFDKLTEKNLNKSVVTEHKHKKLARWIIPIVHRANKEVEKGEALTFDELASDDLILGTVEVGICRWYTNIPLIANWIGNYRLNEKAKLNLQVYIDNMAQPYYRAYVKEQRNLIETEILVANETIDDPYIYLQEILKGICGKFNIDYGNIGLQTWNNHTINIIEREELLCGFAIEEVRKEMISELTQGTKGITRYVADKLKKPYYVNDFKLTKNEHGIKIFGHINSKLSLPLISLLGVPIGAISLSSRKVNFYNQAYVSILEENVKKITSTYLRKKRYRAVSKLSKTFNVFSPSTEQIFKRAIDAIRLYFDSDFIAAWERVKRNERLYRLNNATPNDFYKEFASFSHTEFVTPVSKMDLRERDESVVYVKDVENYENKNANIYKLCVKFVFKSYVVIRISIGNRYEAFINIFSKRKLPSKLSQEQIAFLESVSKKTGMALQSHKLINAGLNNQNDLNETLQLIVDNAVEILSCSSVSLFPYEYGRKILNKHGVHSGSFSDNLKKDDYESKVAKFPSIILNGNGNKWVSSENEYFKIVEDATDGKIDRNDFFWRKENLKSLAALKLTYKSTVLGVLIINYKESQDFNNKEELSQFIEGFETIARNALINAISLNRIKQQIITLETERGELKKQKTLLKHEKQEKQEKIDELNATMEEMLTRATRTSFYLILEGINHEIKNCLWNLKIATTTIQKHDKNLRQKDKATIYSSIEEINSNIDLVYNSLELFDFKNDKPEFFDINQGIKRVLKFQKGKQGSIEFKLDLASNMPNLECFKTEFLMIIYNLVGNSINAIKEKEINNGFIKIITEYNKEYNGFIISIEDNGIGIRKEHYKAIYQPGFSTKTKELIEKKELDNKIVEGTGIGLFFVKKVIEESYYGTITFNSIYEEGTKFTLTIPEHIPFLVNKMNY